MTLRQLLDDLHRLGNADAALDKELDLVTLLDYCAVAGIEDAGEWYVKVLRAGSQTEHD